MGRKIPGRKHRGVRDPTKQLAVRLESLKDKINAPPTNSDEQYIPKSLTRIIELKDKVKSGAFAKKKKKTAGEVKKPKNPSEPVQRRGESDKSFLRRVNTACETAMQEADFEKKYGVEIKKNPETGKVEEIVKKKKDEIDILMRKARKEDGKKIKKKPKKAALEPRLTKSEKRKLKLKVKKEKKLLGKVDDFDKYKDTVKFGEIAHAPPSLAVPKKLAPKLIAKPGVRDLHLKSLLKPKKSSDISVSSMAVLSKTSSKVIDKKGKRKDLPVGVRRQLEKQQKEIIEAYKQIREKKYNRVA